jgi:divinyl chlorophyllide a 8-vinyl-reductase
MSTYVPLNYFPTSKTYGQPTEPWKLKTIDETRRRAFKVMVLGSTGYIGKAVVSQLAGLGVTVVGVSRSKAPERKGVIRELADATSKSDIRRVFDAHPDVQVIISCLTPKRPNHVSSHKIDYLANLSILDCAINSKARHFILLSAICAEYPLLCYQINKARIEGALFDRQFEIGVTIVRPTAYFPYVTAFHEVILRGKGVWFIGKGTEARYNPIAREDLAEFMARLLCDSEHFGRVYPIGGPLTDDNVVTILDSSKMSAELHGTVLKEKHLPKFIWESIMGLLSKGKRFGTKVAWPAYAMEIAEYYCLNDMLAPGYGTRTIRDYIRNIKPTEDLVGYNDAISGSSISNKKYDEI